MPASDALKLDCGERTIQSVKFTTKKTSVTLSKNRRVRKNLLKITDVKVITEPEIL